MEEKDIKRFIEELDKYYHKIETDENYYPKSTIIVVLKEF